jgi:SpoVK/Ycf46/Vps4 family AAA+-type ATPase
VARRVEVSQTWDDVVLPADIVESVRALTDRIAFRNEVLGDWGFARKVGKGLGLTALFSGPPGTGKSMVAGLIARKLGLDLYVIDLSRIMSKWLGETEKNLGRAFDAAEAGHVLLLFDEADTVLGKRTTNMQGANDRHANLETNFILSRLEQFQGIAIFTTNIPSAIDDAIMRRMSAHISFPFPDAEARAELWRRMIPSETPVVGRLDFAKLARDFELTGGYIRNVVLRAAYLAARERSALGPTHFERAVRGEYGERGALTVGGRLT